MSENTPITRFAVSSPGKVILFGEHAVIYGYPAIASSIDLRCYTTTDLNQQKADNSQSYIVLNFDDFSETNIKISLLSIMSCISEEITPAASAWKLVSETFLDANILFARENPVALSTCVCIFLFARALAMRSNHNECKIPSLFNSGDVHLHIHSEIPSQAGLGSSAAFCVSVATTFLLLSGVFPLKQNWSPDTVQCDLIKSFAHEAESIIHGSSSGVDTTISAEGGMIFYHRKNALALKPLYSMLNDDLKILIVDTGIRRSTSLVVEKVANEHRQNPTHLNVLFEDIQCLVQKAYEIFSCEINFESFRSLSSLVCRNQQLLVDLGVSHPAIDKIVHEINAAGLSAKLTGAGYGGCVIGFPLCLPNISEDSFRGLMNSLQTQALWVKVVRVSVPGVVCEIDN